MSVQNQLARALKQARSHQGLTQEDFSDVSSRTYISSLERGLKSPTLDKIDDLAATLQVHPLTLLALAYCRGPQHLEKLLTKIQREASTLLTPS